MGLESSVSVSPMGIPKESFVETSGGRGISGEAGRMAAGTSFVQEVGASFSRPVRMSRMTGTSSGWGEEVGVVSGSV